MIPHATASVSYKSSESVNPSYMNSRHIEIFLSALDLSYAAALKFDCRPGLKFLVQKVADLEQPANLYRQAGAAWTIKFITLFELFLREADETVLNFDYVKNFLSNGNKNDESNSKYQKIKKYLRQIQSTFEELCDMYVEVVRDHDGKYTKADSFAERKIFLLVAQPDDYPEITRKEPIHDRVITSTPASTESRMHNPMINRDEDQIDDVEETEDPEDLEDPEVYNPSLDDESGLEELGQECENDLRPFRLSDLAAEYSTDSGPQSEPETDDSRPASRLGSVTERIVYFDRSGGTSSEGYVDAKLVAMTPAPPEMINSQNQLYPLWRTTSSPDTSGISAPEVKLPNSNATLNDTIEYEKPFIQRRKSEACLLSKRTSLKFIMTADIENFNDLVSFDPTNLRSKSVMELRRTRDSSVPQSPRIIHETSISYDSKDEDEEEPVDLSYKNFNNIDELLRDYERSKRGFRTNPFLKDEEDEAENFLDGRQSVNHEIEFKNRTNVSKDSEAHRKAWAETLSTALEWILALPVSEIHIRISIYILFFLLSCLY